MDASMNEMKVLANGKKNNEYLAWRQMDGSHIHRYRLINALWTDVRTYLTVQVTGVQMVKWKCRQ